MSSWWATKWTTAIPKMGLYIHDYQELFFFERIISHFIS